jgi:hypothetical protein
MCGDSYILYEVESKYHLNFLHNSPRTFSTRRISIDTRLGTTHNVRLVDTGQFAGVVILDLVVHSNQPICRRQSLVHEGYHVPRNEAPARRPVHGGRLAFPVR